MQKQWKKYLINTSTLFIISYKQLRINRHISILDSCVGIQEAQYCFTSARVYAQLLTSLFLFIRELVCWLTQDYSKYTVTTTYFSYMERKSIYCVKVGYTSLRVHRSWKIKGWGIRWGALICCFKPFTLSQIHPAQLA